MSLINGLGGARLQVRLQSSIRVPRKSNSLYGTLKQGKDMQFHPISSLGLGE
jgi:hypothetical protein